MLKGFFVGDPDNPELDGGRLLEIDFCPTLESELERISLDGAKAIFFVKSFAGRPSHDELHFQDELPPPGRLYVRLIFHDKERMEGIIDNNLDLLRCDGFLLDPVDPDSNNRRVYIFKSQIKEFRILALRKSF